MRTCCEGFQDLLDKCGERGFSVRVTRHDNRPVFALQFRAIERGQEWPQSSRDLEQQELVTLVTEVCIVHCPWCGARLEKAYKRDWEQLVKLTEPGDLSIDLESHGGHS